MSVSTYSEQSISSDPAGSVFDVLNQTLTSTEPWLPLLNLHELVHDPDLPFTTDDLISDIIHRYWRQPDLPSQLHFKTLLSFEEHTSAKLTATLHQSKTLLQDIHRSYNTFLNMLKQCSKEQAQSSVSRSLRSPIRSLPVEILCQIFEMCIPSKDFEKPSVHTAPFLLGRVCKHWRDVAWNDPSLWTRPRVRFCSSFTSSTAQKTLRLHRENARNAALELSVTQHPNFQSDSPWFLERLLDTIPRCKSLQVSFYAFNWILDLDPYILSRIEHLSLKFHFLSPIRLNFSLVSHLRSVRLYAPELTCLVFPKTLQNITCSFAGSAKYFITSIEEWQAFLVGYPNLQTIEVYFPGEGCFDRTTLTLSEVSSPPPVTFAKARSLLVRIGFGATLATVLCGFSFPNLKELQLIATSNTVSLVEPTMSLSDIPFVFTLTSLRLIRVEIHPISLRDLLNSTPLLTMLDIMVGDFYGPRFEIDDEALISHLTIRDDETPILLPRLRDLWLYLADESRYVDMARSRYFWASNHIHSRDANVEERFILGLLPTYPFRLHLKYEKENEHMIPFIAQAIGTTDFPVLFPELSVSFTKEI